jgi:catechol 2,3-dioxygenase-like lactoylglutathione lyase family enzyme
VTATRREGGLDGASNGSEPEEVNVAGRLIEVELRVRDVDRSLRFYRDLLRLLFGQPEVHQDGGARHVHAAWGSWAEGAKDFLLFNIYPAETVEESRANVGFAVEDLDEVHATLERAGVHVVHPPEVRAWGRTGVYRDPDEQPRERSEVSGAELRA